MRLGSVYPCRREPPSGCRRDRPLRTRGRPHIPSGRARARRTSARRPRPRRLDGDGHGHSHGLVDRSILRSHAGVKAVALSLAILGLTAGAQVAIFAYSSSVALLADLIHNFGDALTAIPLGIAFFLRSVRGETTRRARGRARDLRLRLCRAVRDDPALHPPAAPDPSVGAGCRGADRVRRQRTGGPGATLGRAAPCERGDDRRRQARADRRLRLPRRRRERDSSSRSALRSPTRSSVSRSRA